MNDMTGNAEDMTPSESYEEIGYCQRRIRHITGIQVRNLTPFPTRDAVASALAQPSEHSQFTSHGMLSDDADITLRRRSRKVSVKSARALRNMMLEEAMASIPTIVQDVAEAGPSTRPVFHSRRKSLSGHIVISPTTTPALTESSAISFSTLVTDNSQETLEKVVKSRLIETFVAISVQPSNQPASAPAASLKFAVPRIIVPEKPTLRAATLRRTSVPDYLSPIHRPSTNPNFPIDARSEFVGNTDLTAERMVVELWGKVGAEWNGVDGKGKGKQREIDQMSWGSDSSSEWKILEEWAVDLAELVPLPDEFTKDPANLPTNTLLVTLSPPGKIFCLPNKVSRAPSPPDAGYDSDPESEVRKVKRRTGLSASASGNSVSDLVSRSRRRRKAAVGDSAETASNSLSTSTWEGLLKLVTLQACIVDDQVSLSEVIVKVDKLLEQDTAGVLKREVSERESSVDELRDHCDVVKKGAEKLRSHIAERKRQLEIRRANLQLAKSFLGKEIADGEERSVDVDELKNQLTVLRERLPKIRTVLISTLSSIFPIELVSPPDLLFTILNVPLPIPISTTDPGPPLSLASHKEVTEDVVATALGYAAQVVQLLAAYLSKNLIYPITYAGSRSLIRDGISAMVGPRMFPLYSKGVDTYRFEYGVFLLNKDIEILMVDRNLRALDMRHTLPNLKNLLLTLTDGELRFESSRLMSFPSIAESESALPDSQSVAPPDATTPKANSNLALPDVFESRTPPASRSATPTVVDSRKTYPFSVLEPLAGLLRGRYPSSIVRATSHATEDMESGDGGLSLNGSGGDDEDDRKTIRGAAGVVRENGKVVLSESLTNGNGVEKLDGINTMGMAVPSSTSPPLTAV